MIKTQILVHNAPSPLKLEILREVEKFEDLEIVGFASNLKDGSLMMDKLPCDVLLTVITDENTEGMTLVRRTETMGRRPLVAVISGDQGVADAFPLCVTEDKLVYSPTAEASLILSEISSAAQERNKKLRGMVASTDYDRQIDEKLTKIFISSGIPPHIKGYVFLREAVKISMRNPMMINNITRGLYPAIAEKYTTTPSKVERAIRHAIEVAWARGKIENLNNLYGIRIFSKSDKPTNGELIALISDGMLTECI